MARIVSARGSLTLQVAEARARLVRPEPTLFGLSLRPGGIKATQEKQAAAEAGPAPHP